MGGCRCSYKSCRSATKTTENMHFFHYPVKHRDRCGVWIKNADKPEFAGLPDWQLRNKVVCEMHFEDKYFANAERRRLVHNAVPTLDAGCDNTMDVAYVKELEVVPTSSDGSRFTLQLDAFKPVPIGSSSSTTTKLATPPNDSEKGMQQQQHQEEEDEGVVVVKPEIYTIDPSFFTEVNCDVDDKEVIINAADIDALHNDSSMDDDEEEDCAKTVTIEMDDDVYKSPTKSYKYGSGMTEASGIEVSMINEVRQSGMTRLQPPASRRLNDVSRTYAPTTKVANRTIRVSPLKNSSANGASASITGVRTVIKKIIKPPASASPASPQAAERRPVASNYQTKTIQLTNKLLIDSLRNRLPESLLGAVSLHLNSRRNAVTREEISYADFVATLPLAGRATLRNFKWSMPLAQRR